MLLMCSQCLGRSQHLQKQVEDDQIYAVTMMKDTQGCTHSSIRVLRRIVTNERVRTTVTLRNGNSLYSALLFP